MMLNWNLSKNKEIKQGILGNKEKTHERKGEVQGEKSRLLHAKVIQYFYSNLEGALSDSHEMTKYMQSSASLL